MTGVANRRNLAISVAEDFTPPVMRPNVVWRDRLENRLRCFVDLQLGSIWRDLRHELTGISGKLLDVGCGAQVFRGLIPVEVDYLGIDTIDAKRHFGYDIPGTRYFQGDDWGVEAGAFDTVLCTEVLEHIAEPSPFLARIHRCLVPGGRLVLTVPFAARWHFIPYDYWRYTPSGLLRLLDAAGFADIEVRARGNPLTVACYKAMALPLTLALGSSDRPANWLRRLAGVMLLPIVFLLACIANVSFRSDWGEDCLGYTVTARRPA